MGHPVRDEVQRSRQADTPRAVPTARTPRYCPRIIGCSWHPPPALGGRGAAAGEEGYRRDVSGQGVRLAAPSSTDASGRPCCSGTPRYRRNVLGYLPHAHTHRSLSITPTTRGSGEPATDVRFSELERGSCLSCGVRLEGSQRLLVRVPARKPSDRSSEAATPRRNRGDAERLLSVGRCS